MAEKKLMLPTLRAMQTGDKEVWPIEHTHSLRTIATNLGLMLGRKYTTKTNREARTITVLRVG
jgi:hypothetical protein